MENQTQIENLKKEIKAIKQDEQDKKVQSFLQSEYIRQNLRITQIIHANNSLNKSNLSRLKNSYQLSKIVNEAHDFYKSEQFAVECQNNGIKFTSLENFVATVYGFTRQWYYMLLNLAKVEENTLNEYITHCEKNNLQCDTRGLIAYSKNTDTDTDTKKKTKYNFVATYKTGDKNISVRIDENGKITGTGEDILSIIKYLQNSLEL